MYIVVFVFYNRKNKILIWIELFLRRCMRFIKMAMNSSNIVVKTVTNMGIYGVHSVMLANKRFLQSTFYLEEMNVLLNVEA